MNAFESFQMALKSLAFSCKSIGPGVLMAQKPSASSRLARSCSAVCAAELFPKRLCREVPRRVESVFASEVSVKSFKDMSKIKNNLKINKETKTC